MKREIQKQLNQEDHYLRLSQTELNELKKGTNYLDIIPIVSYYLTPNSTKQITSLYPPHEPYTENKIISELYSLEQENTSDISSDKFPKQPNSLRKQMNEKKEEFVYSYFDIVNYISQCSDIYKWKKEGNRYLVLINDHHFLNQIISLLNPSLSKINKMKNAIRKVLHSHFFCVQIDEKTYWIVAESNRKYGELIYCDELRK